MEEYPTEKTVKVALAGNPNVGKSTVFNTLTGLHQHTGNWPGKTVEQKSGTVDLPQKTPHSDETAAITEITLVDLPGTYSLDAHSAEEEITRDFILSGEAELVVVVCDGCLLERNLILALQILSAVPNVVVCVNLMDEAKKKGISIDFDRLASLLHCPVVPCAARQDEGIAELKEAMARALSPCTMCSSCCGCGQSSVCPLNESQISNKVQQVNVVQQVNCVQQAEEIAAACVSFSGDPMRRDRLLDRIFTGKYTAFPAMALLLVLVFYLTITGAGFFSDALDTALSALNRAISAALAPHLPQWTVSLLCDGLLGTVFTVVAVMFPPMAIFFPLFTLLEDSGYLPRAAYNIDRCFKCCGSCGKQSLTMMMGFGCNAAGVTGCRIIDSPRERLIAILTNALVPCNGRFPILLTLIPLLGFSGQYQNARAALVMALLIVLCTAVTLGASKLLSATVLKGEPSSFALELPPYRRPRVGQVLLRSLLDRTTFVLFRAVSSAAPAGILLWFATNLFVGGKSLFAHLADFLDPIGRFAGMDGVMMCAFLCALPAAEIMLPLAVMGYNQSGMALGGTTLAVGEIFAANGWTTVTVVCVIVFTLFHFPCATTLMTIHKETRSAKWTALAALLPTVFGYAVCVLLRLILQFF